MKSYVIVCEEVLDFAEDKANEYMNQGYQPCGGLTVIQTKDGSFRFVQALAMPLMVFHEEPHPTSLATTLNKISSRGRTVRR